MTYDLWTTIYVWSIIYIWFEFVSGETNGVHHPLAHLQPLRRNPQRRGHHQSLRIRGQVSWSQFSTYIDAYPDTKFCTQVVPTFCIQVVPTFCTQVVPTFCTLLLLLLLWTPSLRSRLVSVRPHRVGPSPWVLSRFCTQVVPTFCTQVVGMYVPKQSFDLSALLLGRFLKNERYVSWVAQLLIHFYTLCKRASSSKSAFESSGLECCRWGRHRDFCDVTGTFVTSRLFPDLQVHRGKRAKDRREPGIDLMKLCFGRKKFRTKF
jgi:hypothetical protein